MSNQSPLISVIVPVYKAEPFLYRCVDSILNQTYRNLEVILVDDGSPDRSGAICDEYAANDSRIRVIHKENGGVSTARNAGLDMCTGAYICFVDSDDYILPKMYEKMLAVALEHQVDICMCQWTGELSCGTQTNDIDKIDQSIMGKKRTSEIARFFYKGSYEDVTAVVVWNKLYRAEIFENLRFDGCFMEDEALHTILYAKDYSVYIIPDSFYVYCENLNSLTQKPFREDSLRYLSILVERVELYHTDSYMVKKTKTLYCNLFIEYYYKAKVANITMPNNHYFRAYVRDLAWGGDCNAKFVVRMLLFLICPRLYHRLLV